MSDKDKIYNIGLDIGTNSVGWAITDNNYNLLHAKKKNLWGVRLFEAAEPAADRRVSRSTRRRYRRRRNRINWLNEIFADEIAKKDASFLLRLNSSWVSKKDKIRQRDQYNLFMDSDYTDVEYHREFPTIFHLRKRLVEDKSQADIRLVYLALHNIIKYRGNFTYEHQNFDVSHMDSGLALLLNQLNQQLQEFEVAFPDETNFESMSTVLLEKKTPTQKIDEVVDQIQPEKDLLQITKNILKMLLGNKADLVKIFSLDSDDKITVEFSSNSIEQDLSNLEETLSDEQFNIITLANSIYSSIVLNDILSGETYLSFAKARQYSDHKKDLAKLKTMWRESPDRKAVGKAKKAYDDYLHSGKYGIEDFYKDMSKFLETATPVELAKEANEKILNKSYLLKQRNNENGVIPFQLNKNEMIEIINNQAKYYPFLAENKDKLLSILSFRIPYYVGPLQSKKDNPFAWMEKKSQGKIRPWNFDEIVDREASSNNFIRRMTSTDTYLIGEPVLPLKSPIYQKYEVLNELSNVRINADETDNPLGDKLSVDLKQAIYNELFLKHRSVSKALLTKWLINQSYFQNPQISGLADSKKFNSGLTTYHDFKKIFGEDFVNDPTNQSQLEQLAEWLTIFEDKKILKIKLDDSQFNYTPEQIKKIAGMRYQGWGRLSKKLLCDIKTTTVTSKNHQQASYSILDLMWNTNRNFISVLKNDTYKFEDKIQTFNLDKNEAATPQAMIDELQTSPALKRGIRQSVTIIQELVKFMGHAPEHIFLEFTREDDVSSLTKSRDSRLNKLYARIDKNTKKTDDELKKSLLPSSDIKATLKANKNNLSNDRLMLYYLQMGKSLYSNQPLDINRLSEYQIDHILPQSYIKDNSLENRALVLASENQHKSSDLLLKPEIINQNIARWRYMKDAGLMGPKKFKNLTRIQITDSDQNNFINRQLVQTSQIIKHVSNILDSMYGDQGTQCVETRAHLSTEFRKAFSNEDDNYHFQHPEFVKNRNINDYHHAQDAYLACLLGLYQMKKYPTDNMILLKKEYKRFFSNTKKIYDKKHHFPDYVKNGWIIGSMFNGEKYVDEETGQIIWDQQTKDMVSCIFQYKQYNVTKRTEAANGEFYNQTVYKKDPNEKRELISLKQGLDTKLYGGYSGDNPAYIVLVKIDDKKNKLVKMPIRLAEQVDNKTIDLQTWLEENVPHKKGIQVLKTKIPLGQVIYSKKNGYLALKSDTEIVNAQQLVLPYGYVALLTLLQKMPENKYDEVLACYDDGILDNIFVAIIDKMKHFYPYYSGELKTLSDNIDNFKESPDVNKIKTLQQLLLLLHASSTTASIEFNNVKKNSLGRKPNSINIQNTDLLSFSATGLYESRIHID